jgi:hypothetical protein
MRTSRRLDGLSVQTPDPEVTSGLFSFRRPRVSFRGRARPVERSYPVDHDRNAEFLTRVPQHVIAGVVVKREARLRGRDLHRSTSSIGDGAGESPLWVPRIVDGACANRNVDAWYKAWSCSGFQEPVARTSPICYQRLA